MNKIALILAAFSLFGCLREKRHAPVNLVLFARLTASGTQPRDEFFEWPREGEDAISTVRDSDSGTGWKAPIGKESSIEIDIQPWIGEIVPLEVLRMKYSGKKPENVRVELLVGCGGVPLGILEWKDVDLDLDLNGRDAGCMKIDLFATEALSITVLELWGGDFDRNYPVPEIMYAEPPVERHKNSGVIEGFYGIPWSWGERIWMMMNMAWNGLDTYVYAPKNDDLHRENWREPYPSNSVWEFGNLNKWAGMFGITFYFGISPFIDFDFSDGGDFETLREKLLTFVNSGIDGIALLADDIEFEVSVTVDGAMALAQADVANRLFDELKKTEPELRMFFVPTVYSDNRMKKWKGGEEYLKALENLRPEIEIMWTGKGTSNKTMAAGDMEKFTSLTGRKPVIWDNFWANDGGDGFMGRILLGPFSGRSADLPGAVNGIAHNPSIQG
ncbi:MAG: beta-N-acetylglucosaminidase domain-containing protein, partial [Deltaproteobacteria bacterium]|nr:beta-N-acetylglucosaminidase domain-containing protein [Deltaproteobacteria bacterium]